MDKVCNAEKKETTQESDVPPFVTRHACVMLNPSHHSYLPGPPSSPKLTAYAQHAAAQQLLWCQPCAQRRGSSVVPHCYRTRRLSNVIR